MGTAPYTPGGLSNSKLKLATATASDVLNGKTFYSGDKTLKTGKMQLKQLKRKVLGNLSTNQFYGPFSATFSVKDLPGYQYFTTNNFAFSYATVSGRGQDTSFTYSLSYNASTGAVTVKNTWTSSESAYINYTGTVTVVCYYLG